MTQTTEPTVEDIAYVRQLAESGARAPLTGGRFIAWWGLLVALAWTAHHLALRGVIGDGQMIFGIIWVRLRPGRHRRASCVLARGMPAKAGEGSAGNRATRVGLAGRRRRHRRRWSSVRGRRRGPAGLAACSTGSCRSPSPSMLRPRSSPARSPATGSIMVAGAGAIAMVGLFTAFIFHPDRYLFAAAGVVLTVLLPGLLLLRAEPQARD